ncbi:MAG: flagellar hook-associated protein FlgK [Peptostreptococcales bacterium]
MSIFSTLNTATGGLQTQSYAVQTASHNIANANTEGYSRQRVNLEALPANTFSGVGQIGAGVNIIDVRRIRDEFLDAQIRSEKAIKGSNMVKQEVLEQLEVIFLEPSDTGVNEYLSKFWDSWQQLVNYPEAKTSRTAVAETSQTLAQKLNDMSRQIKNLQQNTITNITSNAYSANNILEEIQDLSDQIYRMTNRGLYPNDLYDRRDLFLDQLSSLIDIKVEYDTGERVKITDRDSGTLLLDYPTRSLIPMDISVVKNVETSADGTQTMVINRGGDVTQAVTMVMSGTSFKEGDVVYISNEDWNQFDEDGTQPQLNRLEQVKGELAGGMQVLERTNVYNAQLDTFAHALVETINFIHRDGESGLDLFTSSDGDAYIKASNIKVHDNIMKDSTLINAAKTGSSGDSLRALAINNLRYLSLDMRIKIEDDGDGYKLSDYLASNYDPDTMSFNNNDVGNTVGDYYNDIVVKLGIDAQQAFQGVKNQTTLLMQLEERKESISGVSVDEEAINLIKFQNAYQANARVISTLTEMLDTLLSIRR